MHLVPVGDGFGIQIPPHLIKAAHLDGASDLFMEVTARGLLIQTPTQTIPADLNLAQQFRKLRQDVTLGPLTLKQLIDDGRE